MSHCCFFELLPTELLHILFNYFFGHEILISFYGLNDYINSILRSYSAYKLNFKSISRFNFDLICRNIRSEQVISLTLCDSNDTSGLTELFFSYFQIEQFIRLRSLTLIEIEFKSLKFIFYNLSKLNQLRSFSFDACTIRHTYGPMNFNFENKLQHINSTLIHTYAQILPQLKFLYLNSGWVLEWIPLPNLRYLKLTRCSIDKLETITHLAPQLKSLDHLELHLRGYTDLADGQRWQTLTNSLITFNFKFNIHICFDFIEQVLDSFRTLFWLEEKQWFIAYENDYLFSIPYFAPEQVNSSYQSVMYSTVPDNTIFYNNINEFTVIKGKIGKRYFTNINVLKLKYSIPLKYLLHMIDLNQVKHLSILSLEDLLKFIPISKNLPCLCELSVKNDITKHAIKRMLNYSLEQIQKLKIRISNKYNEYIIEELFHFFPCTKYLIYKSRISSTYIMIRLINGFEHLLNASFILCGPFSNQEETFRYNPDLIVSRIKRLTHGTSFCRIYHLSNNGSEFIINWWIEEQVSLM
ncbi:unnamed protein product [Rotaria sordida]|uniref:F-box domain-containing protein n=2 Tax=Rotaria sordida TaxID=392033 RepID=A0A819E7J4_9BILA|nr:unnamed protein product [Rotaria sordida]CAF1119316.1 unnamed protein product [Rotaria sordida]CAF3845371.1 unnamed protein product [Rotaria sordida]